MKKAASGVLAPLPCSRTGSTLRAPKGLRPCWTDFFEHSRQWRMSISPRACMCHGIEIFNRPPAAVRCRGSQQGVARQAMRGLDRRLRLRQGGASGVSPRQSLGTVRPGRQGAADGLGHGSRASSEHFQYGRVGGHVLQYPIFGKKTYCFPNTPPSYRLDLRD